MQVQGMIERCLQSYMNQTEIITTLHLQANIDPGFTSLGTNVFATTCARRVKTQTPPTRLSYPPILA